MVKIEIEIPSGESCIDCEYQTDYDIAEIRCDTIGKSPQYMRTIIARCRLFNESIQGNNIEKMKKCDSCRRRTWLKTM